MVGKDMQSVTREEQGVCIVALEGDIDLEQSPKAREVLLECVGRGVPVLVDLAKVGYIDSSGVASLVEALQQARTQDNRFALVSPSVGVRRVLELARLDKVFVIHDSLEEGLGGGA